LPRIEIRKAAANQPSKRTGKKLDLVKIVRSTRVSGFILAGSTSGQTTVKIKVLMTTPAATKRAPRAYERQPLRRPPRGRAISSTA
jgi:hypothetical protein